MGQPTVNLNSELHVIAANLDIVKSIWEGLFGKYAIAYDRAKKIVEGKISDAGSGLKNTMMSAVADLVLDKFKGALGIYGDIAGVAITGLEGLGVFQSKTGNAKELSVASSVEYAEQLRLTPKAIFDPFLALRLKIAEQASKNQMMDAADYRSAKSQLLSSPIWFPPYKLLSDNAPVQTRIEIGLWAAFFTGLTDAGHESYKLRFLDDVVKYIMDEAIVSIKDSKGWEDYPEPISQGGPGDWTTFLRVTRNYWRYRSDEIFAKGWMAPLPDIPENAKIQKSVNWTPPKTVTYPAPTKSGKASIRIDGVEMTTMPRLDWGDIPALVDFKSNN